MPLCNQCLDEMYEQYCRRFPSEKDAMRRMCMICDVYWSPALYDGIIQKDAAGLSIIRSYISKLNAPAFKGKTFDDTLDEERLAQENIIVSDRPEKAKTDDEDAREKRQPVPIPGKAPAPSADTILFWGGGLTPEIYQELNLRFQRWTRKLPKPLEDNIEGLYKQLCISEVNVMQCMAAGKGVEAAQRALNDNMTKLGIVPGQQEDDDDALGIETTPMGVWVKRWEDRRPLPEEDEDMKNPHFLIRYINTWFLGHIGKMLGIKNIYTKMYEEEIAKWKIERPEFADEEDDDFMIDLFGENDGDAE